MRTIVATLLLLALQTVTVGAQEFPYNRAPTLKVGQTVVLKGVRGAACKDPAPAWAELAGGLPKAKLGTFSDGGTGFAMSNRCKARVPARGVRYKAAKAGTESFTIFGDKFTIVVK